MTNLDEQIDEILNRAVRKARSEDSTAWYFNSDWHREKIKALIADEVKKAIDDYQTNFEQRHIASAVQLARIDMLKTFMAYEEKQPGYINWDFLDGELTSIELQSKLEDKE